MRTIIDFVSSSGSCFHCILCINLQYNLSITVYYTQCKLRDIVYMINWYSVNVYDVYKYCNSETSVIAN